MEWLQTMPKHARAGVDADDTVSVSWVAKRFKVSVMTVCRYREQGLLEGFQFVPRGWWRITRRSVIEFERKLTERASS
jgi:hypothetical protein